MKTNMFFTLLVISGLVLSGCGEPKQVRTGFLSDYSKLEKESDSVLRYINNQKLGTYSAFMVDPVQVQFYSGAKGKGELTRQEIVDLTNYMHAAIVKAIEGAGKKIAYQPGPGTARLRLALTDLEKSDAISMLPQASLMGAGIGGAAAEAELIDSVTGEQIAASLQSKKGSQIPFSTLGDWTAAKQVMDNWAESIGKRLQ